MSDPTGYKTKKISSDKRRTLSDPVPHEYKHGKIKKPPVITYGKYNDTNITVFGEIYNSINNKFYENINLHNKIVFVEHPSTLCDITEEHKKKLLHTLKGSEWIWYNYSASKLPIVCIDNRLELGLPSGIEEKFALRSNNLELVVKIIMKALRILVTRDTKIKFENNLIESFYIPAVKTIYDQMDILTNNANLNTAALQDTKWKVIQNIMKLSGMLVDINTIELVKEYANKQKDASKKKDIFIFMGAAHAYRLRKFFPKIFTKIEYNTINPDLKESIQTLIYT